MKKFVLILAMACFALPGMAQEVENAKPAKHVRKKFFNISYISDKIKFSDGSIDFGNAFDEAGGIVNDKNVGIKNNWGVSLTRVRTYTLHKKPLARLINIGIDACFFDLSYANYSASLADLGADWSRHHDRFDSGLNKKWDIHKMEYSFQAGPSVTLTPGRKLTVAAYFRYAPTFTCILLEDSFCGNYASMFMTGASISFDTIGVGIEARMGSCKYQNFSGDIDLSEAKIKTTGFRAYLQFRW